MAFPCADVELHNAPENPALQIHKLGCQTATAKKHRKTQTYECAILYKWLHKYGPSTHEKNLYLYVII